MKFSFNALQHSTHQRSGLMTTCAAAMITVLMVGCASKPQVPARRVVLPAPDSYVVQRGDTVSKIAARYGLDYQEIGRINQLDANYTIYPNQRLRLKGPVPRVETRQPRSTIASQPIKVQPLSTPVVPATAAPVQPSTTTPAVSIAASTPSVDRAQGWQWPTQNVILQEFNPAQQVKGMRFGGKIGDAVRAVADGEVVYANNGLKEYGNLVLIRHLNGYISAYAHNSRLLVREGERVRLGQTIAEMGETSTAQVMLELQIRVNGKPINPRGVLPTR